MNKPFMFSGSQGGDENLVKALGTLKVNLDSIDLRYVSRIWNLSYPWQKDEQLTIEWLQQWWPDGIEKEDTGAKVLINDQLVGFVDFKTLVGKGKRHRDNITASILTLVKKAI
jgi:hypothetical protein